MRVRWHKLVTVLAFAPAIALMPATPAHAAGVLVTVGTATIPAFPCGSINLLDIHTSTLCPNGTFSSTVAAGADSSGALIDSVTASFTYAESCPVAPEPLIGVAMGKITGSGATITGDPVTRVRDFVWVRVGLTAVLLPHPYLDEVPDEAILGVAVFVPTPLPNCTAPQPVNALVAGAGLYL